MRMTDFESDTPDQRGRGRLVVPVAVVLLLIVMYVLSPGPVFSLMNRYNAGFAWLMRVDDCYAPAYWLVTRTETTRVWHQEWCHWWDRMLIGDPFQNM